MTHQTSWPRSTAECAVQHKKLDALRAMQSLHMQIAPEMAAASTHRLPCAACLLNHPDPPFAFQTVGHDSEVGSMFAVLCLGLTSRLLLRNTGARW